MRRMPRTEEVTAEDGRFSLDGVAAGTYVVQRHGARAGRGSVSGVKVAAGSAVDVGTVKLGAGGTVRGTVVESGGGPIAGARISATGQGRDWISFGPEPDVVSDGSGAFELKGVAAGAARSRRRIRASPARRPSPPRSTRRRARPTFASS